MTFSLTTNVKYIVEQWGQTFSKPTLPPGWL